jgi:hypothetical protein
MDETSWEYDVALSFAGEDREPARQLATKLQAAGYLVFYDEFEELWGQDLSVKLHKVYGEQARFCVVFVSRHYLRKPWTNQERQVLVARAMREETVCLLPIRLDDTVLPGVAGPPADRRPGDAAVRVFPRNFLGIVVQQGNLEAPWFNLDCAVVNEGPKVGRVRRLEAQVTPAGKRPLLFAWNVFYEFLPGGRVMEVSAAAEPMELAPGISRFVGVQFKGPRLEWPLQWPAGTYDFDILGWVNRNPREHDADLRTRFSAVVSGRDALDLDGWARAPDAAWRRLDDPHNAVAIPVAILPTTLSA